MFSKKFKLPKSEWVKGESRYSQGDGRKPFKIEKKEAGKKDNSLCKGCEKNKKRHGSAFCGLCND